MGSTQNHKQAAASPGKGVQTLDWGELLVNDGDDAHNMDLYRRRTDALWQKA
jgi:hypothetical protein